MPAVHLPLSGLPARRRYGDIVPCNDVERLVATGCTIVGGLFYSVLIGNVAAIVSDHDPISRIVADQLKVSTVSTRLRCAVRCRLCGRIGPAKSATDRR